MGNVFSRNGRSNSAETPQSSRAKSSIDVPVGGMGTALFNACFAGNAGRVKALLDAGADPNVASFVNYPDSELFRPGIPREVGALIFECSMTSHAHPQYFHHMEYGITNLLFPVLHGDSSIVHLLLEAGADPNAISFHGLFPLYVAAELGYLPIVQDLVEHGADVNKTTPKGNTALLNAAEEGMLAVVEYLLKHGADPSIRSGTGQTAVSAAMRCGQPEAARLIEAHVSDCESRNAGDSSSRLRELFREAGLPHMDAYEMEDFLITLKEETKDAMLGVYGQNVQKALHGSSLVLLFDVDDTRLIPELLQDAEESQTVSSFIIRVMKNYFLVKSIVCKDFVSVSAALARGADPKARCRYRGTLYTPIVAAACFGSADICRLLLEAGADANQSQSNSETALADAVQNGDFDMVALLLEHDANPNKVTYVGTALAVAGKLSIVMLLLAYGADPNIPDRDGDLPIIGYIDQRRYAMAQTLAEFGCDLKHRNKFGETPIDRAKRSGDRTMVDIVVNGAGYERRNPVFVPDSFARELEQRIGRLLCLEYPIDQYQDYVVRQVNGLCLEDVTEEQLKARMEFLHPACDLVKDAVRAKRAGDLVVANDRYLEAFSDDIAHRSDYIWGWFKVLLLAKNYPGARLALKYFHAVAASYNRILCDTGEQDYEEVRAELDDCLLTLEFSAFETFCDTTGVLPLDKSAVEEKIGRFSGVDPDWMPYYYGSDDVQQRPYHMSDEEYGLFLRSFIFESVGAGVEGGSSEECSASDRGRLEAEARSGSRSACVELARIVYQEDGDRGRAIKLLERAIQEGDVAEAPFLLGYILEGDDSERAKDLYQMCVDNGFVFDAAYYLGLLVEDEDLDHAKELYGIARAAGNTAATNRLAFCMRDSDPDRAKELYRESIEDGDEYAATFSLAIMLEDEDPEQSKELYKRSIAAGDTFSAPHNLALLLEEDDREGAEYYYRMAIDAGNAHSCALLAWMIQESDRATAIELCNRALEIDGDETAAYLLATLVEGEDAERSKALYERCAEEGAYASLASYKLARLIQGDDPERAAELYERAMGLGNGLARFSLAQLLAPTNRGRAIALLEQAIEEEDPVDARGYLAYLIAGNDPGRAKELYQASIDSGNCYDAANNLGLLVRADEPERAKALFELSLNAGNAYYAARNLAGMIARDNAERAAELYQMSIDAGNTSSYSQLARLVSGEDRGRAIELCEMAVEKGDVTDAPFFLAWLIENEDPERAKRLYQICVDNGYCFGAANNLGNMIKGDDPERAKGLFEISLSAGNRYYAAKNLADMIYKEDAVRAIDLYQIAIDAGNTTCYPMLAFLLRDEDRDRAIALCETAIDKGDVDMAPCLLASMVEGEDRDRAIELYQICVDNGRYYDAASNLAALVYEDDPERAFELLKLAASDGRAEAYNMAGVLKMKQSGAVAADLFSRGIDAGEKVYAPCNLAHMLLRDDPGRAEKLYKLSLENETEEQSTEALIGLGLLYEASDPEESSSYLAKAKERNNYRSSIDFMADYYDAVDDGLAERVRRLVD